MNHVAPLLEPHIPRLRRYARTLTRDAVRADDLVQSCLLRSLAKAHLWHPGSDLRAWLFTILHHQHVNEVRRSVREGVVVPLDDVAPHLASAPSAAAALELHDLERAIAVLPPDQREVVLLAGREGERYEAIAAALGVPVGTVRSRLSRARARLRRSMEIDEPEAAPPRRARRDRGAMRRAA
jgi:RNA polymerase sigma-70 factor (ECF subfamily)